MDLRAGDELTMAETQTDRRKRWKIKRIAQGYCHGCGAHQKEVDSNKCAICLRGDRRRSLRHKLKKMGASFSDYEERLNGQGGICAICSKVLDRPYIDHDHETGRIRGILCQHCNTALGFVGDDVSVITNMLAYIMAYKNGVRADETVTVELNFKKVR